jgi:hypothetical protein
MIKILLPVTLIVLFVMIAGCSKSSPVGITDNHELPGMVGQASILILESGSFSVDLESGVLSKPTLRSPNYNFDVTGFLSTSCPGGCLTYIITRIHGTVLTIDLTLENPTSLQVYDVRIIYENLYGKEILYPDNYTDIFDPFNLRPFSAFAKETLNRAFPVGPQAKSTIEIEMDYPPLAQPYVDYTIIASFPGNTQEPFEISWATQFGNLSGVGDMAVIRCMVRDHQDDVSLVAADTTPITGGITFFQPEGSGSEVFYATIINSELAPPGKYICPIAAMSPNFQNAHAFDYVTLTVFEFQGWGETQKVYGYQSGHTYYDPDIAFDSKGNAHVIWTDVHFISPGMIDYNILYSNNTSGTWSDPVIISDLPVTLNQEILTAPKIAINKYDHICVVWSQYYLSHDARNRLFWNFNNGTGWSGHDLMFDMNGPEEVDPQLTSDDAFFYLAFRTGYVNGMIWASRYNTINPWNDPVNVNDPIDMEYEILLNGDDAITAASRGGTFVAFTLRGTGSESKWQLFYDASWDGCQTWGVDSAIISDNDPTSNFDDYYPSVKMDGRGYLSAVWKAQNESYADTLWDSNSYGNWRKDSHLGNMTFEADAPVLEVMPSSYQHTLHITYFSYGAGLYYRDSNIGHSFHPQISLSPFTGYCSDPAADVKDDGKFGAVWVQSGGGYDLSVVYREREITE